MAHASIEIIDLAQPGALPIGRPSKLGHETSRVIVAHEDWPLLGLRRGDCGAASADELYQHLDAPVRRVGGRYVVGIIRNLRPRSCRRREPGGGDGTAAGILKFSASRANSTSRKELHDHIKHNCVPGWSLYLTRNCTRFLDDAPHARQFARLRAGAHAQFAYGTMIEHRFSSEDKVDRSRC